MLFCVFCDHIRNKAGGRRIYFIHRYSTIEFDYHTVSTYRQDHSSVRVHHKGCLERVRTDDSFPGQEWINIILASQSYEVLKKRRKEVARCLEEKRRELNA